MPIYEYQCQSCEHQLEKLQRMSDDHLRDCPECGKPELRRLVSAAAFRLKGAGWYETDFKKDNKKNLHSSANDSESSSGTNKKEKSSKPAADKTSDSKPAASPAKPKKTASADSGSA